MEWDYIKYPRDVAIYAMCPRCGFKHNPSFYNWATGKTIIIRQFNYCPICGEYLRDPILFTRGNTKVINYETKEIELIETSESNEYE
jgi:hypothetical protein